MIRIRTTHVGSLPHTTLQEALDYSFQFDLPVLPSLPGINKNDFIGKDIVTQLEIGEYTADHKIKLKSNFTKSTKVIVPSFLDEFIDYAKLKNTRNFKYQLIGPISFISLLDKSVDEEIVFEFLLEKYITLLKDLKTLGLELFVLDEPLLSKASLQTVMNLNKFIKNLESKTKIKVGIHFCCLVEETILEQISGNLLHFDINLYLSNDRPYPNPIKFAGLKNGLLNLQDFDGDISTIFQGVSLISSECGLFFKTKDELNQIINNLNMSKSLLLESNT